MIDHDDLLAFSNHLTPLPPTIVRLARLLSDFDCSIEDVIDCVALDPSITGSVLRRANSPLYGARGTIGDIQSAIVRIGLGALLETATRASIRPIVDGPVPGYGLDGQSFWRHCGAAARAADAIRRRLAKRRVSPLAVTAALLHDIGKLAISQFLVSDRQPLTCVREGREVVGLALAEREVLGVDHAEVGGLIVQRWCLPDEIRTAISYHHDPDAIEDPTTDVVHVADSVARVFAGAADDELEPRPQLGATRRLGFCDQDLADLRNIVAEELAKSTHE